MTECAHCIAYFDKEIKFSISYRERATTSIKILPDLSILVVAPVNTSVERIYRQVFKHGSWILQKISSLKQLSDGKASYQSGGAQYYLGRAYRLQVIQGITAQVSMVDDRIVVSAHYPSREHETKDLLVQWFIKLAQEYFTLELPMVLARFPDPSIVTPRTMTVKKLKARWGSMDAHKNLLLNSRLIHTAPECIHYVIAHELCHIIHLNHSKRFWSLLQSVLPEWKAYKKKLEEFTFIGE